MATHHPIRKTVPAAAPAIPDKLYFRIGDVASILEVPAYVLRFWETEFPQLKPNKGGTGQRLYRRRDVEMALRIKSLLYDQGYTIPGARQALKSDAPKPQAAPAEASFAPAAPEPSLTIPESALAARALLAEAAHEPHHSAVSTAEALRAARIDALRNDLRNLLTLLSNPVSGAHPPVEKPESRPTPLRPLLVLERPTRSDKDPDSRLKSGPRLQLHQPGLFGVDDSGPSAS